MRQNQFLAVNRVAKGLKISRNYPKASENFHKKLGKFPKILEGFWKLCNPSCKAALQKTIE